ncbi:hypothetical protein CEXT_798731 [Caerostris extrusa]|uniref:Uncharacterized protein n=1 Tax=Caerostris extrusa TaxID=172846 RepID=A0AAV4M8P7_CAEEX|nr:hypothetical protein CEXT_798731 [Caerostris extrusa]
MINRPRLTPRGKRIDEWGRGLVMMRVEQATAKSTACQDMPQIERNRVEKWKQIRAPTKEVLRTKYQEGKREEPIGQLWEEVQSD